MSSCRATGRCGKIARFLRTEADLAEPPEYTLWTGRLDGVSVAVCSTGIGGPSAAIALEELVECGADTFIRVGTSGGIVDEVCGGDIVIATAAIRQEERAANTCPSSSQRRRISRLLPHCGRRQCGSASPSYRRDPVKDSFYGEIRPAQRPVAEELLAKWKAWKATGALTSEMEVAALFIVAQVLHVRCGAVLNVLWNADNDRHPIFRPMRPSAVSVRRSSAAYPHSGGRTQA